MTDNVNNTIIIVFIILVMVLCLPDHSSERNYDSSRVISFSRVATDGLPGKATVICLEKTMYKKF